MRIQTEYMSFKNHWTISSSNDFQVHLQHTPRRCVFFIDWSTVIRSAPRLVAGVPRIVLSAPSCSQACCWRSQVLPGAPKVLPSSPRCSLTYYNHSHGTPVPVSRHPIYSDGPPECPPRVWYSPEIDAFKFTLHILSDTSGGYQSLQYILLMESTMAKIGIFTDAYICSILQKTSQVVKNTFNS